MALGMGRMLSRPTEGIIIAEVAVVCGKRNYSEDCYFCDSGMLQLHGLELIILQSLAHLFLKKSEEKYKNGTQRRGSCVVWTKIYNQQLLVVCSPSSFSNGIGIRILSVRFTQ